MSIDYKTLRQAMIAVINQVPDEHLPFVLSCDDCPPEIKVHCGTKNDGFDWCLSAWIDAAKSLTLESQIQEWSNELVQLRKENLDGSI